ncbi:hypothetical protein H5410_042380 [Solanum commersonii]|uniref:Uncharacterized protein n=1 Tax=Solanum commersonii TaxID=4109 RepID=A0A9J5XVV3_SOLCO|nr:hypothetical protein H5410_042380 [Solanum commersonii]
MESACGELSETYGCLKGGLRFNVKDGRKIMFWEDDWRAVDMGETQLFEGYYMTGRSPGLQRVCQSFGTRKGAAKGRR